MTKALFVAVAFSIVAACGGTPATGAALPSPGTLTVLAAASLQPAFDKIGGELKKSRNVSTTFSYAGTQTLATQLQQGAPADVFASADTAHMTTVQNAGLLAGSSKIFAHNRLEIAVAKGNPKGIHTLADLSRSGLVVLLADPSVPAGKYALQALSQAHSPFTPRASSSRSPVFSARWRSVRQTPASSTSATS